MINMTIYPLRVLPFTFLNQAPMILPWCLFINKNLGMGENTSENMRCCGAQNKILNKTTTTNSDCGGNQNIHIFLGIYLSTLYPTSNYPHSHYYIQNSHPNLLHLFHHFIIISTSPSFDYI